MRTYLVGGAVRDILLGKTPKDRDYVVVGATPEAMIHAGFKQVGAAFQVYLHPETGDEYALARTETKVGTGHTGFVTEFAPHISLEDDLVRRDLTINAMAMDADGTLIDPLNGRSDLENGILRATSDAFGEDPLRILRTARFAARFGYAVETGTAQVCAALGRSDEFRNLTRERVGVELMKTLETDHPERFFEFLQVIDILDVHFPEIAALVGQTQPAEHHPEGDAFVHTMLVLRQAVIESADPVIRFAALVHDLGKGITPKDLLPKHHKHEKAGVPLVEDLCTRLRLPSDYKRVGQVAAQYHGHIHKIGEMTASGLGRFAAEIGADHSRRNIDLLSVIGRCDARGRLGREDDPYPEATLFEGVMTAIGSTKFRDQFSPEEIAGMSVERRQNEQARLRVEAAKAWLQENAATDRAPSP